MGLFSSEYTTYVSSVAYNLAGDELLRPNYLKTVVAGAAIAKHSPPIGTSIVKSYLNGPGISLRAFARWARTDGYNAAVGTIEGQISTSGALDLEVIASQLPADIDEVVLIQTADVGIADYSYWVDRFMLENYRNHIDSVYTADLNEATGEITVTIPGVGSDSFTPTNFDKLSRYIYVSYNKSKSGESGPLVEGDPILLGSSEAFPSLDDYTETSYITNSGTETLSVVVLIESTYSDSRLPESTNSSTTSLEAYTDFSGEWTKSIYEGRTIEADRTISTVYTMYQSQSHTIVNTPVVTYAASDIGGGVTKYDTITTTTQTLKVSREYREDSQQITETIWTPVEVFIYREGGGNSTLDTLFTTKTATGAFFPVIPIRIDNHFVSDTYLDTLYPWCKKAVKRSLKGKYDEIVEKLNDNDAIGDIDFAHAMFGVALNVKENACKRYIYEFLRQFFIPSGSNGVSFSAWRAQWQFAEQSRRAWNIWYADQLEHDRPNFSNSAPVLLPYPTIPVNKVRINSDAVSPMNFDITLSCNGIEESSHIGLGKVGAKVGELWIELLDSESFSQEMDASNVENSSSLVTYVTQVVDRFKLYWQVSANVYKTIEVWGFEHINMVYGGKAVRISSREALEGTAESGFIIPLHESIYKNLPLTVSTQMSTACCFLLLNCYQVVETKWYQTGAFAIFVIIIVIVIVIYFPETALTIGEFLGSNPAVGTALGFTGTAAIVASVAVNAIAGMILTQLLTPIATEIFGEKLGAIVATVAAFVIVGGINNTLSGKSFFNFSDLMKGENILKLTAAVGNGYSQYLLNDANKVIQDTQALMVTYNEKMSEVFTAYKENLGLEGGVLDPLELTDVSYPDTFETRAAFLSRTLLTGSEVSQLSLTLLNNFAQISLSLDLPT